MKYQCDTWIGGGRCVAETGHTGECFAFASVPPFTHLAERVDDMLDQMLEPLRQLAVKCLIENGLKLSPDEMTRLVAMGGFDSIFPGGLNEMYGITNDDPLKAPLPPTRADDWDTKDRHIEWVRANFTKGMLAKLYKLSYDVDGVRRESCDAIIKKG